MGRGEAQSVTVNRITVAIVVHFLWAELRHSSDWWYKKTCGFAIETQTVEDRPVLQRSSV